MQSSVMCGVKINMMEKITSGDEQTEVHGQDSWQVLNTDYCQTFKILHHLNKYYNNLILKHSNPQNQT